MKRDTSLGTRDWRLQGLQLVPVIVDIWDVFELILDVFELIWDVFELIWEAFEAEVLDWQGDNGIGVAQECVDCV